MRHEATGNSKRAKGFGFACGALLLTLCESASAQSIRKIPRIGVLEPGSGGTCNIGFQRGLRDLGYVERQNIVFETRYAESVASRLSGLAAELVNLKPEVL